MKNFKYIIFIFIIGCNSISNETQIIETIQIKENQQVKLNDFIEEVEIIPLSNKIDIGLISKIVETKDFFILADLEFSFKIMICDKNFNLLSEINRYGEGPEEYLDIIDINFNEGKQLIEILTSKNFLHYNTNGNFVDSFSIPFFYIQNLIDISENEYLTYSQNLELGFEIESDFFIKWNIENNEISTVSKHIKNMAVISTRDQNNMFKHNDAIYASHVYLDTIYIFENDKIKKIFLDFPKENLPFSLLTFELLESQNSILDTDQFAFHYPFIRISDQFILSKYIVNNVIYFFIQNKSTKNVISGRKFIDNMNLGITSINPILLDQKGNLFTAHEYEDLWARTQNGSKNTLLYDFIEKNDPNINFVLIKYKLKDF